MLPSCFWIQRMMRCLTMITVKQTISPLLLIWTGNVADRLFIKTISPSVKMVFLCARKVSQWNKPLLNLRKDGSNIVVPRSAIKAGLLTVPVKKPCSDAKYGRNVHLILKDNPRLFNDPPRGSDEWKLEYNARTSAERCNKREKIDYKLEDGRYRSSMMWYFRLSAIMTCQHLDAWILPKTSLLKDLFEQAA